MILQAELVLNVQAALGEGPHWDQEEGKLYWVDVEGKQLRSYDSSAHSEIIYSFETMVSAVIPSMDGGWVLAMQDGIYSFRSGHPLELLSLVESEIPGNRLNDAKCDRTGRLWFGTMSMDFSPGAGSLYVLQTDGKVQRVLSGIGCSNGIAWDDERGLMYYIDTLSRCVSAFDWHENNIKLSGRRTVVQIPASSGYPDGMTIDSDGMLWIAHWGGGCVSRWNPDTGQQIATVEVPARHVTSCTFGGKELDELYITTARPPTNESETLRFPLAGGLFKVNPGATGVPANRFRPVSRNNT